MAAPKQATAVEVKRSVARLFALWMVTVFAASIVEWVCGYHAWDIRRSSAECIKLKADLEPCHDPAGFACPAISLGALASLGKLVAVAGPLLSWLPSAGLAALVAPNKLMFWLAPGMAYFALIMPFRVLTHTHAWDPSGHIFMAALQLVPAWAITRSVEPKTAAEGFLRSFASGAAALLWLVTLVTAAMYHDALQLLPPAAVAYALHIVWQRYYWSGNAQLSQLFGGLTVGFWLSVAAWAVQVVLIYFLVLPNHARELADFSTFVIHDIIVLALAVALIAYAGRAAKLQHED